MIEELRHMLLVYEEGTLTAAARRAHLSQPALTASLQRLEEFFDARLFDRGRHGAQITAAGQALLPRARAALAAIEDGKRAVAEVEGLEVGEVRLGAGATATTYLLPRILARFRRAHPGVHYLLREGFPYQIRAQLSAGELDIGVVSGEGNDFWRRDELIVVASPKIDPDSAGFVTFMEGSNTRSLLHERLGDVEIVMELAGIAAVKSNARAGMGKALLSRSAVESDLQSGRLVEIPTRRTPIRRKLFLIHRGEDRLPPAAAALRELLLRYG
jgi:DNA-binding transcriptional LysR family regulator